MRDVTYHERALVGMVLLDPLIIDRCSVELIGYQWTDEPAGKFWLVLLGMRERGEPILDARAVLEAAKVQGIESPSVTIAEFANDAGVSGNEAYHVGEMLEHQAKSKLRGIASEIMTKLENPKADSMEIQEWITSQMAKTAPRSTLPKSASELLNEIVERSKQREQSPPIESGFIDLDCCIGGFRPGQLAILAARPSIGKSALGGQIAVSVAKNNHAVLFISLEMSAVETVSRLLAMECGVSMASALDGALSQDEIEQAESLRDAYRPVPLLIEDKRGLNVDRIEQLIRATSSRRKLGLVVVDYLGLISFDRRKVRWEAIGEITSRLKTIAQTEQVPILVLCQLNRMSEGEKPELSHLRDSGSIEQDADIVLLLHRETRQDANTELYVAKSRNGTLGKIELVYDGPRFQFQSTPRFNWDGITDGKEWNG